MRKLSMCMMAVTMAMSGQLQAQGGSVQDVSKLASMSESPVVIYTAKEFITMDPAKPRAEAIAVQDGRILAVGSKADVGKAVGSNARLDKSFNGKVVMPGFIEQHVHPLLAALTMNTHVISIEDWDTIDGFSPAVRTPEEYSKRLKASIEEFRAAKHPADKAFVSWGYHNYMHGKEMSRELLDKLAPDFPVVIWHRSVHEVYMNTKALEAAKIDDAYVKTLPESAQKQISLQRGHLYEQALFGSLRNLTPLMANVEILTEGLEYTETYYHNAGITTAAEPGGSISAPLQKLINSVYSDDATPFNHYFIVMGKDMANLYSDDPAKMIAESRKFEGWGQGRTQFLPKQAKLFTDGAIFSQLMQMKDGYTDGHKGEWIMNPDPFDKAFQAYWDAGFQLHIHNNGDAGMDQLLSSMEKAMARSPRTDHRSVLVHFGFARPEQIERWIELGGIVSSNPYYVTALAGRYGKLGMRESEVQNMVPHSTVLKKQGHLSFHSDMPMAPAKPLQLVWAAVNRTTYEGNVAGAEHKVPLDTALKAITIEAAYSIQQENRIGSLEVGKDANLTILEKSPYDVKAAELKDIGVWGTMLEGRVQPVGRTPKSAQVQTQNTTDVASLQTDITNKLIKELSHHGNN